MKSPLGLWPVLHFFTPFIFLFFFSPQTVQADALNQISGVTIEGTAKGAGERLKFKAFTVIPSSILEVMTLLRDTPSHCRWVYLCHEVKILKWLNPRTFIYSISFDGPALIKDRHFIGQARFRIYNKQKKVVLEVTGLNEKSRRKYISQSSHRIVIPEGTIRWELKPMQGFKGRRTWVSLEADIAFGGYVPLPVRSLLLKNIPVQTFTGMKNRIAAGRLNQAIYKRYIRYKNWH